MQTVAANNNRLLTYRSSLASIIPRLKVPPSSSPSPLVTHRTMATYSPAVNKLQWGAAAPVPEGDLTSHHVKDSNGERIKFQNPHESAGPTIYPLATALKILRGKLTGTMPTPNVKHANIPIVEPKFLPSRDSKTAALRATWLGHACYYVEFPSGLRVLFDPVFEDRCTPVQWFGPKRYSPPPCKPSDIAPVDAVLISHSHYDHLSHTTVLEIAKRNPYAHFFVGLGLERWFRESGIENVTELDWWEDAELVLSRRSGEDDEGPESITAKISCLPSQHASGRTLGDRNHSLWASWGVSSGEKSVWFGGDTGYRAVPEIKDDADDYGLEYEHLPRCPQFEQIGRLRGPFDLGLIPIGAYKPRWMWSSLHANPRDSVEIFRDTKCKRAMGIHWGTWVLTSEEVDEPPKLLKEALKECGIAETGVFDVCAVGESREFSSRRSPLTR